MVSLLLPRFTERFSDLLPQEQEWPASFQLDWTQPKKCGLEAEHLPQSLHGPDGDANRTIIYGPSVVTVREYYMCAVCCRLSLSFAS